MTETETFRPEDFLPPPAPATTRSRRRGLLIGLVAALLIAGAVGGGIAATSSRPRRAIPAPHPMTPAQTFLTVWNKLVAGPSTVTLTCSTCTPAPVVVLPGKWEWESAFDPFPPSPPFAQVTETSTTETVVNPPSWTTPSGAPLGTETYPAGFHAPLPGTGLPVPLFIGYATALSDPTVAATLAPDRLEVAFEALAPRCMTEHFAIRANELSGPGRVCGVGGPGIAPSLPATGTTTTTAPPPPAPACHGRKDCIEVTLTFTADSIAIPSTPALASSLTATLMQQGARS